MKKLTIFISLVVVLGLFYCCKPAIEKNIGKSYVMMSWANQTIPFKDTLRISGVDTLYASLKDSTIQSVGVYRSGLSDSYPEIHVKLKIDSVYLKSMIQQANDPTVPDVQKSSTVLSFKGGILLPASCYQFSPDVTLNSGQLVADVSLVVSKSKLARINSTKIFLPIAIDTTVTKGVNPLRISSYILMSKAFVFKKI